MWYTASKPLQRSRGGRAPYRRGRKRKATFRMINFKRPTLEDRANYEPLLQACGFRSCEYSFTNLLTWAEAYDEGIAQVDGFAVVWIGMNGSYLWPSGRGDRKALLETLRQDSRERGVPFTLAGLTAEQCQELETLYPGQFRFANQEDAADYCYTVEKLSTLSGKKLHSKRNHIHRFEERYPNWHTELLGEANLADCVKIAQDWAEEERKAGTGAWGSRHGNPRRWLWRSSTGMSWGWTASCCTTAAAPTRRGSPPQTGRWPSAWAIPWAGTPMTSSLKRLTARYRGPTA